MNIDLWGLQAVHFSKALKNNQTFQTAYQIQRETSGGKQFEKALKGQDKFDVYYTTNSLIDGFSYSLQSTNFQNRLNSIISYLGKDEINDIKALVSKNPNKSIFVIGTSREDCKDNCSSENVFLTASNVNHEEVAHGIPELKQKSTSNSKEHKVFFGLEIDATPDERDILKDKQYQNTQARKQLIDIMKIAEKYGFKIPF